MITLTTAAWISLAVVTLVSILAMKGTVRLAAGKVDNGWDNAVAYVIASGVVVVGCAWVASMGWFFAFLVPLLAWTAQTIAIKQIYQVRLARAWLIGTLHTFVTSTIVGAIGLSIAFVAAYILYGKIISDPMFLIRLLLKLIGIELPF
jgi:hypothetical protein